MSEPRQGATQVKSAERVLQLLEVLARARQPVPLGQLQRELAIPRSSLHALLNTMVRAQWAAQQDGAYTLGPVARLLGSIHLDDTDLVEVAVGVLARLRDELGETVHLATLDGTDTLYLASRFSPHALGVRFQPGRRLPAQITALGKAMLATCPAAERTAHLPDEFATPTAKSVRSPAELAAQLAETAQRGYAIDNEETAAGLRCFAVALSIPSLPPHAISCSAPVARLDPDIEARILAGLERSRDEILRLVAASVH
ncbi:IclR family transcriptional regulator [Amycolatopsis sp. K13G38]|uniref:IclR family transcriptional regulator n=1 Tax=Amycolatopsis acididurans TaxID=2724524 RepID=A0ABX1IZG5_9PSEU|nr:IclR family transcriptional regulator [Amycolatopsis acididurans]NKQ52541.1 IclR family transcriptional regulator [Amycolatopsis acididurans]